MDFLEGFEDLFERKKNRRGGHYDEHSQHHGDDHHHGGDWGHDENGRDPHHERRNAFCPQCGKPNTDEARFCMHCGAALVKPSRCGSCGCTVEDAAKFCPNCGAKR